MPGRSSFAGQIAIVVLSTALGLSMAVFMLWGSKTPPFGRGGYRLNTIVPASALLTPGARVTMAGAQVGHVTHVERSTDGRPGTRVELDISDQRVAPVPVDSRIQVRTRSQVGENYVAISVGRSSRTFQAGDYVPETSNDELVDVDQILSVLNGRTKARARKMIAGLGGALDGHGDDLNATLQNAVGIVENGGNLVRTLDRDRAITGDLVDQLGRVASEVGSRGVAIDTLARGGVTSLRAIGDRDEALSATLRALPRTLTRVRHTSETVGRVTPQAKPVIDNLTAAIRELAPAARALAPASREGRTVVAALGASAPKLQALLAQSTALSAPLPRALPELRRTLCQVNPALRYLEPYRKDFLHIVVGLGSASNSYDALGHLIRLAPVFSDTSVSGLPPAVNDARSTLLNSGLFLKSKAINWDAYMKPGAIGTTAAHSDVPRNPADLAKRGYVYPRVKADCLT